MSEDYMDARIARLVKSLEGHCKRLNLLDGDVVKAINRIKVKGLGADLGDLALEAEKGAGTERELVAMAFAAFKRAHEAALDPKRFTALYSMGEYDSTSDKCDEPIAEMRRAVNALKDL